MGFPSGEPAWQVTDLQQLAAANQLFGINPLVLAGVAGNESGYEVKGAGINSEGYGGFFGLGQNSSYSYGGSSFQDTAAELSDPGSSSFELQAQTAAAEIAHLLAGSGGNLQSALASYTGGGPDNGDYELAIQFLAGAAPAGPNSTIGTNQVGEAGTGGTSSNLASTTAAAPTLNPAAQQQLSGVPGILQDLDSFLNPHINTPGSSLPIVGALIQVPGNIEGAIVSIVSRGLFTIFFGIVLIGGIYMIVKKPVNFGLAAAGRVVPQQQRIAQEGRRLRVSQAAESRRYAAAGLQDPFG
jgi:hypothetical protein